MSNGAKYGKNCRDVSAENSRALCFSSLLCQLDNIYSPNRINLSDSKTKAGVGKFSAICVGDLLWFTIGKRRYFLEKSVWSRD